MKNKATSKPNVNSDINICIHSAFEDLQLMIRDIFTNVGKIQPQLSFKEFVSLFERYDWQDIMDKIEELENFDNIDFNIPLFIYLSAKTGQIDHR